MTLVLIFFHSYSAPQFFFFGTLSKICVIKAQLILFDYQNNKVCTQDKNINVIDA